MAKIHSDEIKLIVPPGHPLAAQKEILAADLIGEPLLLPKTGTTRSRLTAWLEAGGGRDASCPWSWIPPK